jgi:glucose-fructose oxidoreductase
VRADLGGGPLFDIGIYCINAARNIFRSEPLSVFAFKGTPDQEQRFDEVDEHFGAVLRFPGDRVATFMTSFGAADISHYEVLGTGGKLRVEPAYEFDTDLGHVLTVGGKTRRRTFKRRDQVAPELIYFSDCIMNDRVPEPSGREGLADVRIILALNESAKVGERVDLDPFERRNRPNLTQELHVRAHETPSLIHARVPTH